MSFVNVLSSAPPQDPIYRVLAAQDQNIRLQKINETSNTLDREVNDYRLVAKKYKRAKRVVNGCVGLSTTLSSASLGSALSSVGLPASIP